MGVKAHMGKKMKLPFLSKNKETGHPWQWHSCKHPKTLSFRAGDNMFKTVNSVFFDPEMPESSWFTNSSESPSFSTESEESAGESLEVIIRGVQSDRLFFEPGGTSSILEEAKASGFPFKESVVMAMESDDPYVDFRRSMEEMVESHGLKDWECLEELLGWYLRVNGKMNHGFIVGAFIDLLVGLDSSHCSDSTSYSSAAASFSSSPSPPLSPNLAQKEIEEEH
ncbi:transcription repressor OFP13 [Cornus florida]|uniref:transcription repressor OFP13 n=1 Tax=Cornus florida TaxID=4283 RepID=UPI00289E44F4|nr:transcription repressor OFP13 [Cornus florida]